MPSSADALEKARVAGLARAVIAVDDRDAGRSKRQRLLRCEVIDGQNFLDSCQGHRRSCAGISWKMISLKRLGFGTRGRRFFGPPQLAQCSQVGDVDLGQLLGLNNSAQRVALPGRSFT